MTVTLQHMAEQFSAVGMEMTVDEVAVMLFDVRKGKKQMIPDGFKIFRADGQLQAALLYLPDSEVVLQIKLKKKATP